jgi:hypothetical protein
MLKPMNKVCITPHMTNENHKELKKEIITSFQKFGYVEAGKNYDVRIKITAGNIAWININSIEVIK